MTESEHALQEPCSSCHDSGISYTSLGDGCHFRDIDCAHCKGTGRGPCHREVCGVHGKSPPLGVTVDKVIRDYHSDGDFVWTDVEVGALVKLIEDDIYPCLFAFEQWVNDPTSTESTYNAMQAAITITEAVTF